MKHIRLCSGHSWINQKKYFTVKIGIAIIPFPKSLSTYSWILNFQQNVSWPIPTILKLYDAQVWKLWHSMYSWMSAHIILAIRHRYWIWHTGPDDNQQNEKHAICYNKKKPLISCLCTHGTIEKFEVLDGNKRKPRSCT